MKIKAKTIVHERLFDESSNPHLTANRVYLVVEISDTDFRIINNNREPILYQKELFDVVDSDIPQDWIREDYEDGEYYINPPNFGGRGFYEDYFDGVAYAVEKFEAYRASLSLETVTHHNL